MQSSAGGATATAEKDHFRVTVPRQQNTKIRGQNIKIPRYQGGLLEYQNTASKYCFLSIVPFPRPFFSSSSGLNSCAKTAGATASATKTRGRGIVSSQKRLVTPRTCARRVAGKSKIETNQRCSATRRKATAAAMLCYVMLCYVMLCYAIEKTTTCTVIHDH